MSQSPAPGLVSTTPQASLGLLDAAPDPRIGVPPSNSTGVEHDVLEGMGAGGLLLWDSDAEQFHLYAPTGAFTLRRNEIVWPDGTTLRGEDLPVLLGDQQCVGPRVLFSMTLPVSSFAGRFADPADVLGSALPQALPAAPPGTVAVLRARHSGGALLLEGDGEQLHLRTTEGWFTFRDNCITFPHGQMLCGEELCPPPLPLSIGAPGRAWEGGATVGTFTSGSWRGGAVVG